MAVKKNPRIKELLSFLRGELEDWNAITQTAELNTMIESLERASDLYDIRIKEIRDDPFTSRKV